MLNGLEVASYARLLNAAARVDEVFEASYDIHSLGNRYPQRIQAGKQQRVAIARTDGRNPGVLLLTNRVGTLDASLGGWKMAHSS